MCCALGRVCDSGCAFGTGDCSASGFCSCAGGSGGSCCTDGCEKGAGCFFSGCLWAAAGTGTLRCSGSGFFSPALGCSCFFSPVFRGASGIFCGASFVFGCPARTCRSMCFCGSCFCCSACFGCSALVGWTGTGIFSGASSAFWTGAACAGASFFSSRPTIPLMKPASLFFRSPNILVRPGSQEARAP